MIFSSFRLNKFKKEHLVPLAAFLLFLATAAYYNFPEPEFLNTKFGWEYGNIAESLVLGHGFANAFTPQSGPTAWMPPLFVFFLAGVFKVFGVKTLASMWAVFLVKYLALASSLYFLLRIAKQAGYERFQYLLAAIFILLIYFNRDAFFRSLHDDWVILFFLCWALYAFSLQVAETFRTTRVHLLLLAILLPLTNPVLTLSFAVTECAILLKRQGNGSLSRVWGSAAVIFVFLAASTLAWTARNYRVFDAFIPIKSNFWYDFYQANVLENDGLTTNETFAKYHLINKNKIQEKYLREGEANFTASYKTLSAEWITSHPAHLLSNIGRRAFSAFVYSHYVEDIPHTTPGAISPEDLFLLQQDGLVYVDESFVTYWVSISLPQNEFENRIQRLPLGDSAGVLNDWLNQRAALEARKQSWMIVLKSLSLSIIPSICILVGLLISKIRNNPIFAISTLLYLTSLAPYVLASFYRRYQAPLIGLQSVFIFFIAGVVLETILPHTPPRQDGKGTTS
jgi:hypothetical protein